MKKIIITALAIVIVGVLAFGISKVNISVDVGQSTVEAEGSLPEDVSKFQDGDITCYMWKNFTALGETRYVIAISCVK